MIHEPTIKLWSEEIGGTTARAEFLYGQGFVEGATLRYTRDGKTRTFRIEKVTPPAEGDWPKTWTLDLESVDEVSQP